MTRQKNTRSIRPKHLIVCNGTKTEKYYFEALKQSISRKLQPQVKIRDTKNIPSIRIAPRALDPESLVRAAKKLCDQEAFGYNFVWVVFDKDDFENGNKYANAISKIKRKSSRHTKWTSIWSNSCFELWLLLHFKYYDTPTHQNDYIRLLSSELGVTYKKNAPDIYDKFKNKQNIALENSKRLIMSHTNQQKYNCNPATNIHEIIEELLQYIPS